MRRSNNRCTRAPKPRMDSASGNRLATWGELSNQGEAPHRTFNL